MADDEWDRRLKAVVRVTAQDVARALKMRFTAEQRKAAQSAIEMGLYRWMDNEIEMYSKDDDDEAPNISRIDKPPAGNA